jgi:hypothetical protein
MRRQAHMALVYSLSMQKYFTLVNIHMSEALEKCRLPGHSRLFSCRRKAQPSLLYVYPAPDFPVRTRISPDLIEKLTSSGIASHRQLLAIHPFLIGRELTREYNVPGELRPAEIFRFKQRRVHVKVKFRPNKARADTR